MIEYRQVELDNKVYKVDDKGKAYYPDSNRAIRSDANIYKAIMDKLEKKEYALVKVKEWNDYGSVWHLNDDERKDLKEQLIDKLTLNQKLFAEEYILGEHKGNQTQAYLKAFDKDEEKDYQTAARGAYELLATDYITKYIQLLMVEAGFHKQGVDAQLHFLIEQFDDKRTKLNAIKEWNRLHQRIVDRLDISGEVKSAQTEYDISRLTVEEMKQLQYLRKKMSGELEVEEAEVIDEDD